jgi:hypothetical protein
MSSAITIFRACCAAKNAGSWIPGVAVESAGPLAAAAIGPRPPQRERHFDFGGAGFSQGALPERQVGTFAPPGNRACYSWATEGRLCEIISGMAGVIRRPFRRRARPAVNFFP